MCVCVCVCVCVRDIHGSLSMSSVSISTAAVICDLVMSCKDEEEIGRGEGGDRVRGREGVGEN